jgi:hypothetical protein
VTQCLPPRSAPARPLGDDGVWWDATARPMTNAHGSVPLSFASRRARIAADGLRVVSEGASMGAWEDSAETILDAA